MIGQTVPKEGTLGGAVLALDSQARKKFRLTVEGIKRVEQMAADVRLAVRSHRRAAPITLAAVLTLALGIGATTAVFSVANGLILRPLPVPEPERLVTVTSAMALRFGFQAGAGWNYAMWDQLRQRGDAFAGGFAWTLQRFDPSDGGEMQPLNALVASGDVFRTLGVHALIGRPFTSADDTSARSSCWPSYQGSCW